MACPTCGKTMEFIVQNNRGDSVFICPICGTVRIDAFGQHGDKVYIPALVHRCREFEQMFDVNWGDARSEWNRLGINESINTPENRS